MDGSPNETIVSLFANRVRQSGSETALWIKRGEWESLTWDELARDVFRAASWLVERGVEPGDRVVQLSENRYEWIVSDIAIQFAQAVHVPIHAPLTGQQVAYQIRDSGARIVLLSTAEQAAKLAAVAESLPSDLRFFSYDETTEPIGDDFAPSFWQELAEAVQDRAAALQERALANLEPSALATILYTSGTTGEPKGVLLTQGNLVSNALGTVEAFGLSGDDLRLNFLPLSHIFARTCDLYTWIATGCQFALAESRETVIADCAALHPTLLNGVPYFYDKVMRVLIELGKADDAAALRELLGGRIKVCCSGGAALPDHVFDFFHDRGVPLLQGYGLSESSPVITLSSEVEAKRGAVGKPIPDVDVRIAEDGEILTRGPHVMIGYYQDQAATDEVIRDGWLHTGDLGHLDDDGFLFITGRKKELIVTSGGKNVAPVLIESLLTEDPLILQAVVIGDGRKYLAALIVPDPDALRREITERKIRVVSADAALRHPKVLKLFEERIAERLETVSAYEQVRKFTLMNRGFTIDSGELTPKLSLRRERIFENCSEMFDAMYEND
jgi:long-chain acyl-CoA synthetase